MKQLPDDLAAANVNRAYSLSATSLSVFTFILVFLYPRFATGSVDAFLFQLALVVMGVATFSFVFASFHYYGASLGTRVADDDRLRLAHRGDRFWLLGYALLFLAPSLILFAVGLTAVGTVWALLWLAHFFLVVRYFPQVITPSRR